MRAADAQGNGGCYRFIGRREGRRASFYTYILSQERRGSLVRGSRGVVPIVRRRKNSPRRAAPHGSPPRGGALEGHFQTLNSIIRFLSCFAAFLLSSSRLVYMYRHGWLFAKCRTVLIGFLHGRRCLSLIYSGKMIFLLES